MSKPLCSFGKYPYNPKDGIGISLGVGWGICKTKKVKAMYEA